MSKPLGQPKKWPVPEALEADFASYIEDCRNTRYFPTVVGFCVFCGVTRECFYHYKSSYDAYSDTIKRIEDSLEATTIQKLMDARNPAGAIFYMKNKFGYADKQEISASITQNSVPSEAELETKLKKLISQYKTDLP